MWRRLVSIVVLLGMPGLSSGIGTIAGDEHVAIRESMPYLQLRDNAQITLHSGADVAYLEAADRSQVLIQEGARVSHLTAAGNATVTIHAGTEVVHVQTSGHAVVVITGGTIGFLHVLGQSQAHLRQMTIRGGTFAAPGVSVSGGALVYAAEASIHLYATDLDVYQGKVTGIWGTGEPFAFWVVARQETEGNQERFHLPQAFPPQVMVHDLVVASFDCAQASTAVDKTICADRELAGLDRRLARLYRQSLTHVPEAQALQASQARWLRTRRHPCQTPLCLTQAYEERITALQRLLSPQALPVPLLAPEKAKAICQEVLTWTNTGQVEKRLLPFAAAPDEASVQRWQQLPGTGGLFITGMLHVDYNRDGTPERLAFIEGGGTCGTQAIVDLGAATAGGGTAPTRYLGFSAEEVDNDDHLRWANWGRAEHFRFVQGEPVVVTANV